MHSPSIALDTSSPAPAVYGPLSGTGSAAASAVMNSVVFDILHKRRLPLLARYEGGLSSGNETQQIRISPRAAWPVQLLLMIIFCPMIMIIFNQKRLYGAIARLTPALYHFR